jgi:hypothetical protein
LFIKRNTSTLSLKGSEKDFEVAKKWFFKPQAGFLNTY